MSASNIATNKRARLIILALMMGLTLTALTVAADGSPDFTASHKIGSTYARPDDVITYTIVAANAGTAARNVVLTDDLPGGVEVVPDSCTYVIEGTSALLSCDPMDRLWSITTLDGGTRVTTTFAVTVTTDTLHHQLVNRAHLEWEGGQLTMPFTTTLLHQIPDFSPSYKTGQPQGVDVGDVITYTIVAVNDGDPVSGVVLSDVLPGNVTFVTDSCTYDANFGEDGTDVPCGPPPELWRFEEVFTSGGRITTTFAVTVTEDELREPLVNQAYLLWDVIEREMTFTTTWRSYVYLPLVLRAFPPLPQNARVTIAGGDATVHRPAVTLTLHAEFPSDLDEVASMRFSGDGEAWGDWMPYADTHLYTLTHDVSELKTVYAQFRGSKGGVAGASDRVYLLLNGDFEAGAFAEWEHGGELNQFVRPDRPHAGAYSALLGDPAYPNEAVPVGSAWTYQTIVVPDTGNPTLSFWYRIFSYDVMYSEVHDSFYDYFDAYLQDGEGQELDRILRDGYTGPWQEDTLRDLGWQRSPPYDLGPYAGQTVRVYFANFNTPGNTNDPGLNTYTYVDDVTIEGSW